MRGGRHRRAVPGSDIPCLWLALASLCAGYAGSGIPVTAVLFDPTPSLAEPWQLGAAVVALVGFIGSCNRALKLS